MTPLLRILTGRRRGRLSRIPSFEPCHHELVAEFGFGLDVVDLAEIEDKEGLMATTAVTLNLPDWFGHNWDALQEAVGDRLAAESRVLVFDHWDALSAAEPKVAATLLEVANDAVSGSDSRVIVVTEADPGPDLTPPT